MLDKIRADHGEDIERLAQDVQNEYSFTKVSFIYGRLKKMGPWRLEDFNMELILEIDMMQSALAVEYARIFVGGSRKVSRNKIPEDLRHVHDSIMELRNKRYAHDDNHFSVENFIDLEIQGEKVLVKPGSKLRMVFGAPSEWEPLIQWLGKYLHDQSQDQLQRLTDKTGYEWGRPSGPPPDWL